MSLSNLCAMPVRAHADTSKIAHEIFTKSPLVYWVKDGNGTVVEVSPNYSCIVGIPEADVLGRRHTWGSMAAQVVHLEQRARADGTATTYMTSPDGRQWWVQFTAVSDGLVCLAHVLQ